MMLCTKIINFYLLRYIVWFRQFLPFLYIRFAMNSEAHKQPWIIEKTSVTPERTLNLGEGSVK